MLKPDFPKKGKEEVERKGRNEKKRKKRTIKKKEKEGFSIEDRKEVKMEEIGGKQSNSRSMKEREWKIFRPDKFLAKISDCRQRKTHFWCLFLSNYHSKSFSTGDIPNHMNKEEKTETPSFLSKKTLPSRKSYWSVIVCLIFDSIGNRVQNKVMVQLWFGNRVKHLPV